MSALNLKAVEIIGHRGASHEAPENTLASFQLAWEQEADAVELDIRLTGDGHAIVIHDANTKGATGASKVVAEQPLAELRTLDAGRSKGPQWRGEKLPTLQEAVAMIPEGRRLLIEIKCGPEVLPVLEQVITASGKRPEQLAIIGFGDETVRLAKLRLPRLQVYWVVSLKRGRKPAGASAIEDLIAKARAMGVDGLDLEAGPQIDAAMVRKVHQAGLQLYVWTVDDPELAVRLVVAGVDGITTNRPGWLRERLT